MNNINTKTTMLKENRKQRQRWCLGAALMTLFFVTAPFFSAKAQMMYKPQNEEFSFPSYYYGEGFFDGDIAQTDNLARATEELFFQLTKETDDYSGEYIFACNISSTTQRGLASGIAQKNANMTNYAGNSVYPAATISFPYNTIVSGVNGCMVVKVEAQEEGGVLVGYTLYNTATDKYIDVNAEGSLVETTTKPTDFWFFSWINNTRKFQIYRTIGASNYYLKNCATNTYSYSFAITTSDEESSTYGYSPRLFKKSISKDYTVRGGSVSATNTTDTENQGKYIDSWSLDATPIYVRSAKEYNQIIYPKDSLAAGTIKSIAFYSVGTYAGSYTRHLDIYMLETDKDEFSGFFSVVNKVPVFSGDINYPTSNGWQTIEFQNPFVYSKTNNLVVAIYGTGTTYNSSETTVKYRSYVDNKNTHRYKNNLDTSPATEDPSGSPTGTAAKGRPYALFVIIPDVEEPVIDLASGTYNTQQTASITCSTAGATIYYTTDGSDPAVSSSKIRNEYNGPITIDHGMTLRAVAVKGTSTSTEASATYTFQPLPPVISNAGLYGEPVDAVIIPGDNNVVDIYYTTDGTTPTTSSTLYTDPFLISSKTTVKAIAVPVSSGWENSEVASGTYNILNPNGMTPDQNPAGLVMNKTFTPSPGSNSNNSGTITLESFVKGTSITVEDVIAPTDIVLVLDVSSSMTKTISGATSRFVALDNAVKNFLDLMKSSSVQPDGEVFPGEHHRVSFVTYGDYARLWHYYNQTPSSPGSYTYNTLSDITGNSNYFTNSFYEVDGTDTPKNAWHNIYMAYPNGEGTTELQYTMPVIKRLFDLNSPAIVNGQNEEIGTRNRLVVVFTDGGIGGGTWGGVNGDIYDASGTYYAEGKANYTLQQSYILKNDYKATMYSVGLFPTSSGSNYYPTVSFPSYNYVYNNGVQIAPTTQNHGVGWEEETTPEWAQNASRFMALRSSNYPFSTNMTTPGNGSNDRGYFIVANNASALASAFERISQTVAAPSLSLGTQTVVEDVISDAFMLPENAGTGDIQVYTAQCNGYSVNGNDTTYSFANPEVFSDAQVSINGKRICVTNFDFAENWVGVSNNNARGKKLIITIPIVRDMSGSEDGGIVKTNGDQSGIYGEDSEQVGAFLSPEVFLSTPDGCFDFEDVTGIAYNVAGNLPAGWHGYITNDYGMGGTILYPPHVVSGTQEAYNFPYDGVQSLLLSSGSFTNAISYATMPAMYFTSGNDMELNFYYKTEGTGNGECSLAIGYVTSIPADNASDWESAFHTLATLPTSAQSEAGSVFTVSLSGVPTNEDVYIAFKWYYNYTGLTAFRFCNLDGVCVQEPSTPHLWTEFVTSYSQTVKSGTPTFVVDDVAKTITISSEEALAWLISYVNGFNGCTANNLSGYTVTLTKDLNMNAYVWVPIGINATKKFCGTFDGVYHIIDGIHIKDATEVGYVEGSSKGTNGDMIYTGMFGYVDGATIRNTFMTSGRLASDGVDGNIGAIAGYANNSAFEFCETAVNIEALSGDIYSIGGIAGKVEGSSSSVKAVMVVGDINLYLSGHIDYAGSLIGYSDFDANIVPETFYTNHHISGTPWTKNMAGTNSYVRIFNNGYADGYKPNTDYTLASAYTYGSYSTNNTIGGTPMVDLLNSDATLASGYKWIRAAGSNINGGYPIVYPIAADSLACVAKIGSKVLRFGELNEMLEKYADSTNYEIFMYNNDSIYKLPGNSKLYIDEHVAMKQDNGLDITATVSITLDNSKGTAEMQRDWHMFSTSLQKAPLGIKYTENEYQSQHGYLPNAANYLAFGTDYWIDENGYFPAGIAYRTQFDFYSYYEPQYHWINLKRKPNNHWHEDEPHTNIAYTGDFNQTYLEKGKGYLVALGNTTENNNLMQTSGKLTNGDVDYTITASGEHLKGYNLMGNPYQSYLDFNAFATENEDLIWSSEGDTGYMAYLIFNADAGGFEEYLIDNNLVGFSQGAATTTSRYLNMHQGFFIVKTTADSDEVTFTNDMRVVTPNAATFRSDVQPTYPLVNLFCTDSDGKRETVIMELERPLKAGSNKMKGMLNGKCNMYAHWGHDDLGAVFIDYMPDYVPVWFEAAEDGVFTITWSTANANFGYMHLIDNIAGVDYDCLAPGNDHYTFTSSTTDMVARFRVVFKPLGIDEVDGEVNGDFAFFNGEELIVNGEGELSLIDVNGRVLTTRYVTGQQSAVALPTVAEGMYLLRLTRANDVKVQKIVIRK